MALQNYSENESLERIYTILSNATNPADTPNTLGQMARNEALTRIAQLLEGSLGSATFVPPGVNSDLVVGYVTGSAVVTTKTNKDIELAYGSFSSSGTQSIATGTSIISYTDTEASNNIVLSGTTQIYVLDAGTYLITYSAVAKSNAPNVTLDIWLMVDGVDVPRSNTVSKFVGTANERVITVTYIYTFTAGQYFQLEMHSSHSGTQIVATTAGSVPTRPASPSIILTINKISN